MFNPYFLLGIKISTHLPDFIRACARLFYSYLSKEYCHSQESKYLTDEFHSSRLVGLTLKV